MVFPGEDLLIYSLASSYKIEAKESSIWMEARKKKKKIEVFFFLAWFHVLLTSWLVKGARKKKKAYRYKQ